MFLNLSGSDNIMSIAGETLRHHNKWEEQPDPTAFERFQNYRKLCEQLQDL